MERMRQQQLRRKPDAKGADADADDEGKGKGDANLDSASESELEETRAKVVVARAASSREVRNASAPAPPQPAPAPTPRPGTKVDPGPSAVKAAAPAPVQALTPMAAAAKANAAARAAAQAQAAAAAAKAEAEKRAAAKRAADAVSAAAGKLLKAERLQRTDAIEEQRSKLPAVMMEQELVETVLANDVTLVCGETGCGKSTQVPQFLFEAGVCNGGTHRIAVTQPRRVAAISVSQRVGVELNDAGLVGYQVRYESSRCGPNSRIKFMTDGILLREVQSDFRCTKYSAIIIDEAHERGINCDILIGLLSRAVLQRRQEFDAAVAQGKPTEHPPLRLIIMSATLRLCDFTENNQLFPTPPPVVRIDARTFPVTVHFARFTDEDYIKAAHKTVMKINKQLPPGTILVFVTGREEVRRLCRLLRQSAAKARALAAKGASPAEEGDEAEDEEDEDDGEVELLEASDDEGNDFDDDLEEPQQAGDAAAGSEQAAAGKRKKKKARKGAAASEQAASSEKKPEETSAAAAATAETAPAAPAKAQKKKKKKAASSGAASSAAGEKDAAKSVEEAADDGEMLDISYRIDAEEDVVVLDPEADATSKANAALDAKDAEAKQQKRQRMAKLDRSRTAGGVFKGNGFGEGDLHVVPLFAQLPAREQMHAFAEPPDGARVVIVATNVAETSVTLPNTRYVVDCGHEKRRNYSAASGVSAFKIDRISKASADQRAGRAGRLGPGHTYRLYSAAFYENHFRPFAPIAMLHTPMDPVLLLLASLGVPRLDYFPWPTPPPPEAVAAAARRLRALGAIQDVGAAKSALKDDAAALSEGVKCTPLGHRLTAIPVAPRYAQMLLAAVSASAGLEKHILSHACALVAAFSIGNLTCWESAVEVAPGEAAAAGEHELARLQREANQRLKAARDKEAPRWSSLQDDAEGLLWLMGGYAWAVAAGEEAAERFCHDSRVNARQISEAHSLMQQLGSLLQRRLALADLNIELELPLRPKPPDARQAQALRRCILDGLVDHVAVHRPELGHAAYVCADLGANVPIFAHSSSNVYRHRPRPSVLVFNEIVASSGGRHYMRDCTRIDPLGLSKLAASGACSLLRLGEFLAVPAPRYLPEKDQVLAFVSPSYTALDYSLPTVEMDVPTDNIFRYKVFAQALLEGAVLPGIPPKGDLLARPTLVLQAPNNPRVLGLVGALWEKRVGSRKALLQRWREDPRFLLEGLLRWLPASRHDDVRADWPPAAATAAANAAASAGAARKRRR
eukprot:TRINITY_DN14516_c1_g1_i2.p1 TRINITY_DN14516_c1_g1~~TRINITY_DN14516_c1_g1_i2.p1  ORF type:complete len:1400 (+),score=439.30 TRINITY_DN14516_c1_g1_i2:441-4202(+)